MTLKDRIIAYLAWFHNVKGIDITPRENPTADNFTRAHSAKKRAIINQRQK